MTLSPMPNTGAIELKQHAIVHQHPCPFKRLLHPQKNTPNGKTQPGLIPGDAEKAAVLVSALQAGGLLSMEGLQREVNSLTKIECFGAGQGECFSVKHLINAMKTKQTNRIFLPCPNHCIKGRG